MPLDDTAADKNQELHGEGNEREVFAVRAPGDAATARSGAYDAEFEVETLAWAQRLAAKSPLLMAMGKDALAATRDLSLDEALDTLRGRLAQIGRAHV